MTLVDKPLVQYAIDEARAAGIREFIFVTSRGKGALEDYFDEAPQLEQELRKKGKTDLLEILRNTNMESGAIAYIRQHKALGLGHAVWCARRLIANEPFAVILPDDVIAADKPCLQQMVEAYEETGGSWPRWMGKRPRRCKGSLTKNRCGHGCRRTRAFAASARYNTPLCGPITPFAAIFYRQGRAVLVKFAKFCATAINCPSPPNHRGPTMTGPATGRRLSHFWGF